MALAEIRSAVQEEYGLLEPAENNVLVATVGLPRAGKSAWVQTLGIPIVNPDQVRLALHGHPYIPEMEELVWFHVKVMVRALFYAGHKTVVLDSCLINNQRRLPWGTNGFWHTAYVHFPTPDSVCSERAVADKRMDLLPVISSQTRLKTAPDPQLDCGAVITITYEDSPVRSS